MRKQSYRHSGAHKNLSRLDYLRTFNPIVGEKLRQMFEEAKQKEKGK